MSTTSGSHLSESDEVRVLREALEKIRLHGSSFWSVEWGRPSKIANDALNEADHDRF